MPKKQQSKNWALAPAAFRSRRLPNNVQDLWRTTLARWRGVSVFAEFALQLGAFPCLNLQRVVHFRQVERPSTGGTLSRRQARLIELAAGKNPYNLRHRGRCDRNRAVRTGGMAGFLPLPIPQA